MTDLKVDRDRYPEIRQEDIEYSIFRGQKQYNDTDIGVSITHIPYGVIVHYDFKESLQDNWEGALDALSQSLELFRGQGKTEDLDRDSTGRG